MQINARSGLKITVPLCSVTKLTEKCKKKCSFITCHHNANISCLCHIKELFSQ